MKAAMFLIFTIYFQFQLFSQEIINGASMRDDGAYVIWWNRNQASWTGIPTNCSDKILELNRDGKMIKYIALRSDGSSVILWDKNEAWWSGIPKELSDKILELNKNGETIKQIDLRDDGAWVILWNTNEAAWSGIPKGLSDKILELNKDGKTIKQVAMRDDGAYVILWNVNEAAWSNIPAGLSDKILELNKNGKTIKNVALRDDGSYVIFWDKNEAAWNGIPKNLSDKILELNRGTQVVEDYIAPEIAIYEPTVSRGYKITASGSQISVRGKATDQSGISEVLINQEKVFVDGSGNFQRDIYLAYGDNTFEVKATDNKNNTASYTFYVNRPQNVVNNNVVTNNPPVDEKRLALVIGNSNYGGGMFLKNPVNDANLIAQTLQNLGFKVIKRIDANKQSIEQAVREFSKLLPDYNIALFYYAGHGMQVEGINYLIPTDAKLVDKADCKFEAVSVNFIVEEFENHPDNTNIVILDACRNNPFRSWVRGGERGFKAIAPSSGTIIAFATSEGATASDGKGENGLFTQELVKQMKIPQTIENVFKKTRVEVEKESNNEQSPQEWTKLKGDFWFVK